jgi:hypothetical protein
MNADSAKKRTSPKKYHSVDDVLRNTDLVNGCMEWVGCKNKDGYPACGKGGIFKSCALHREVFRLVHGHVPEVVMHTCDNRRCLNPAHLLPGTPAHNLQDKLNKGRQAKGARNGNSKLQQTQVDAIRVLHAAGSTYKEIMKQFAIAYVTVWRITAYKNWGG